MDERVQRSKLLILKDASCSEGPWSFLAEVGWKRRATAIA